MVAVLSTKVTVNKKFQTWSEVKVWDLYWYDMVLGTHFGVRYILLIVSPALVKPFLANILNVPTYMTSGGLGLVGQVYP